MPVRRGRIPSSVNSRGGYSAKRGVRSRLRGGKPLETLQWPTLQSTSVPHPYIHSTSDPPVGLQRTAMPWRPAELHPLGGTEVSCKVGLRRAAGGWPPLNLLFYPLACLCASYCSISVILASTSQPETATLPTSVAQGGLPAWYCWLDSGGWPLRCQPPLPHVHQRAAGGLLGVNRWPPCLPLCLLSPLGGRL